MLGGRGAGKTRAGAEWVRQKVQQGTGILGMIAPTASDARKVLVEGESGILAVSFAGDLDYKGNRIGRPAYKPGSTRLVWENGAVCHLYSAEEADRLRGPQHEALWCDELAAWKDPDTWDMAMFGLRLGMHPQVMATTTPKPVPTIREIIAEAKRDPDAVKITKDSTYANRAFLAAAFFNKIIRKYEGTTLGRQELEAELLEEAEGALWTRADIEKARREDTGEPIVIPSDLKRIVVSIDPPATSGQHSALAGIVVAGIDENDRGIVLEDLSKRCSPGQWAARVCEAYAHWEADMIVAEINNGGEMVEHTIRTVDKEVPVKVVHASRGKRTRAEPVKALYEQGRVKHGKPFEELEDQMATWEPNSGLPSPDRLDAMVWAITELMVDPEPKSRYTESMMKAVRS